MADLFIPLTKGYSAVIDSEDYEKVMTAAKNWQANDWGKTVYAQSRSPADHRVLMLHRVVMDAPSGMCVDHINHDTLDNRKSNLRIVTKQQNQCNVVKREGNSSRFKGVCWNKRAKLWYAYINVYGKRSHLGYYKSEEDAARAYDEASLKLHGEYGLRNFGAA